MLTNGRRILIEWAAVAVLATMAVVIAVSTDLLRRADNLVYDRLIWLERQPASDDIIIVAIDDESVDRIGGFPWPREVHARLLDRLRQARPRAILYDVLFVDPSPQDAQLAQAVAGTRPILPLYMEVPGRNGQPVTVVEPVAPLRRAGAAIGHANISPDEDGIVRRIYLAEGAGGRVWPHVAALAACRAANRACALPAGVEGAGLARALPYLIPYAGGRQHFRSIPFSAVLDGGVPAAFFRNKIVLVGATATGLSDVYATPFAERNTLMPGVELNANIVQALISGRAIAPAGPALRYGLALAPLWLLLAGFLFARPRFNLLLGLGLGFLAIAASAAGLLLAGLWVSPVTALAALIAVHPLWAWRRLHATTAYMHEELERFRRDPDLLLSPQRPTGETVQSDIELLRGAIGKARDLQHFIGDTLKALPDASLVTGPDGRIRMLNDRARALLGDVEGKPFSAILVELTGDKSSIPPDAAPGDAGLARELADRSGRIFDVRWSPIRDRNGAPAAWVLRLADMTELRLATRQREEALQLLTHDMRSPQASIIATLGESQGAVGQGVAKRIEGYARRTLALADGFVQLARAEAQPLAFDEINLADVLVDAADDLWPQAEARRIRISTEGCEEEILVRGDRALLIRAAINLIGNAIKYGGEGSEVRCTVSRTDAQAALAIADQGPGISEEEIAQLFQPFRRLGIGGPDGAGLGLAFVRSVAARHGGSVACQSVVGEGSCFEFRLPLQRG